jgi:flagellin
MSQVINTNYLSLVAQNNLNKSQSSLNSAIERLSSGMRINSAKDDAAGQAIANRFTANVKGLTVASRNANDGISIAQTTEGSLNEINNNLQRVRELSVQAANGTNSDTDLGSIQAEIKQRLDEIDRVSAQTQFNGVNVLASDRKLSIQVGAKDGETIDIDLKKITSATLGLDKLDVTTPLASVDYTAAGTNITEAVPATSVALSYAVVGGSTTVEVASAGTSAGDLVVKDGTNYYAATYDKTTNVVSYDSTTALAAAAVTASSATGTFVNPTGGDLVDLSDLAGAGKADANPGNTYKLFRDDAAGTFKISDATGTNTWTGTVNLSTGVVSFGAKDAVATVLTTGYTEATGQVLTVPGTNAVPFDMTTVNAAHAGTNALLKNADGDYLIKNTGTDGTIKYFKATAAASDGEVTAGDEVVVDPLAAIDNALSSVDSLRSSLGAIQNRFESTITNLNNTTVNLSAARSRIEDADYAVEVSNMTRAQILQQAGTSVLAQANQTTQGVLSLLR